MSTQEPGRTGTLKHWGKGNTDGTDQGQEETKTPAKT